MKYFPTSFFSFGRPPKTQEKRDKKEKRRRRRRERKERSSLWLFFSWHMHIVRLARGMSRQASGKKNLTDFFHYKNINFFSLWMKKKMRKKMRFSAFSHRAVSGGDRWVVEFGMWRFQLGMGCWDDWFHFSPEELKAHQVLSTYDSGQPATVWCWK